MAAGAVNLRTCRWQPQQRCAAGPAYRVCSPCSLVANSSQRGELCVTRGLYSFGSTTPSEEREQLFEGRVPRKVFRRKGQ